MAAAEITTPERAGQQISNVPSLAITEAQKQALIDNLQLEVTERARKLRAQYALQAQALRTRLELRVNRIPQSLRKANMQELLDKYTQQNKPAPAVSVVSPQKTGLSQLNPSPARSRGLKRTSEHFQESDDKENAQPVTTEDIANPKKRTKPNPPASIPVSTSNIPTSPRPNTAVVRSSAKRPTSTVLSPKSNNACALARSPVKSPPAASKPTATTSKAIAKPTRTASRQTTKRAAPATRPETRTKSRPSTASDSSATTTITRKPVPTSTTAKKPSTSTATITALPKPEPKPETKKAGAFKSALSSLTGSKKGRAAAAAAAAKEAVREAVGAAPAAGGRVLRKRT